MRAIYNITAPNIMAISSIKRFGIKCRANNIHNINKHMKIDEINEIILMTFMVFYIEAIL